MIKVIAITNDKQQIISSEWLAKAESVHRQLRPQLPQDYLGRMHEVFANGTEMAVAVTNDIVAGVTVFRIQEKTFCGRELYCDDLVSDEKQRSSGVGHALMQYMENICRERGCDVLTLDSGTHREQAHKFYFREGLTITSFHFHKRIK